MGLSRNKVAVSEGAAGSPPFYGERGRCPKGIDRTEIGSSKFVVQFSVTESKIVVGAANAQGPPVPIPNTEVKLCSAENTSTETSREDRSVPTPRKGSCESGNYTGV